MKPRQYRVLVTGSRTWTDESKIKDALLEVRALLGSPPCSQITIVHGKCPRGADRIAVQVAEALGMDQEPHPADWLKYGKSAGFKRNREMVEAGADYCLAFVRRCLGNACTRRDEHGTHGAMHCSVLARRSGIVTTIYYYEGDW